MADTHSIEWSTAIVTPLADAYELRVQLDASPQKHWCDEFNEAAEQREREAEDAEVGWSDMHLWGETIVVRKMQHDAHDAVRVGLEQLVAMTNERARLETKADEVEQQRATHAAEMESVAENLTNVFRRSQRS